jgi:hypothetical protein
MPTPKFKKMYELMHEQNEELFESFSKIHARFITDKSVADQFHSVGRDVTDVMRDWERRLCAGMERGMHGQYSNKVAEKFWAEAKKEFSHIELVGVKSSFD